MTALVEPVPDALLFDTDVPCSLATLLALKAIGFQGGIRTVTFSSKPDPSDVTAEEVQNFMQAGLGLMLYQRVRNQGWIPSATLGSGDASVFVDKGIAAGYLAGCTMWDDLEGVGGDGDSTIAYANAKATGIQTAKFDPGEYIGFEVPLTGDQLFTDLISRRYWRSPSNVPAVESRGYAMFQIASDIVIAGVEVDVNFATADKLGGRPFWMRSKA